MREIVEVPKDKRLNLRPLFKDVDEFTFIDTGLEGHMGVVLADSVDTPALCRLEVGDFTLFAGNYNDAFAGELVEEIDHSMIVLPSTDGWRDLVIKKHKENVRLVKRYEFYRTELDYDKVTEIAGHLPKGFEIRRINPELAEQISQEPWSNDLIGNFDSPEDFYRRGVGFCAIHNGKIVAGASSYSIFNGGIEIEIDTHRDFRGRGLATAVGARLIVHCLKKGIYPSWDAANEISRNLAVKLGYQFKNEYEALMISY